MSIGSLPVAGFKVCAANFSGNVKTAQSGASLGFLCTVTGTLNAYDDAAVGTTTPIVTALGVTAGTYYPLPFCFASGFNLVLSGGAAGTLAYV